MNDTRVVESTSNIKFCPEFSTFRLYAGNSLYSFCIGPELSLEHLYWGVEVEEGYDLRYLSQSVRNAHFNTVEAPMALGGKIVCNAETLEEVQKTWKSNKNLSFKIDHTTDMADLQRRRLENYSWRIMSKASMAGRNDIEPSFNSRNHASHVLSTPRRSDRKPLRPLHKQSFPAELDLAESPSQRDRRLCVSKPCVRIDPAAIEHDLKREQERHRSQARNPSMAPATSHSLFAPRTITSSHRYPRKQQSFDRSLGKLGKGALCCEYADYGTGDYRPPSFIVVDNLNGSNISPLRYKRHAIYKGKLPMPDSMPAIRCLSEDEASTLVVTMADNITGLEVDLVYVAMHDYDVITRRAVFRNVDKRPCSCNDVNVCNVTSPVGNSKVVQKASSATVDFETTARTFYMVHLSGSWARERYVCETRLTHGIQSIGSLRGVSGHIHNPFAAICIGVPNETSGEVRGFSFIYSGNFLIETSVMETGRLRINVGINPMGLQWHLMPACEFNTPEVALSRSSEGLGGLSRTIHRLFLDRLLPRNWSDSDPPVLLNSWEAKYFHVNHHNIVEMAQQASRVGINLIVLDDGWFGQRNNETSSLGDWVADVTKFPNGIQKLAEDVNAAGCKFGIWFEPEMASTNSNLFASHPDWCLHVPGRPLQISRNQMVLDLSRPEVRNYVFQSLAAILSSAHVEYVKWDMNRPLTEVYSMAAGMDQVWQAEVSHRYMLGVYDLQQRINSTFPHVLLENCASGGGRFDPGMLYYSPQIWCSDNTDALARMKIQYGTSLAYPARCIGAHVATVPNHITGSTTRLRTRAFVAMCGTFGYELDLSQAATQDLGCLRKYVDIYKQIAPIVCWGDIYRLWSPFKLNLASWMYVSRDKSQAVVFAFSLNSDHWSNLVPRLQLQGLEPDTEYEVSEPLPNNITQASGNLMIIETEVPAYQLGCNNVCLTGRILMRAGLPVKFYTLDDSVMFLLRRASSRNTPMSSPSTTHSSLKRAYSTGTITDDLDNVNLTGSGRSVEVGEPISFVSGTHRDGDPASAQQRTKFPILRHITT